MARPAVTPYDLAGPDGGTRPVAYRRGMTEAAMSERQRTTERAGIRVLEPVGGCDHTGTPTSFRVHRAAEPAPKRPTRLLHLPPIWTRASFWLPVANFVAPAPPTEPRRIDPHDDFAA
jgi:hypothetical protein